MDLLEMLKHRRSVREYTRAPIPKEQLEKILAAGLLSPSGRSRKPWELVIVQNRDMLKELVKCREGAANMLEKAGCAILVFADPEKTDVWTEDCSIVMSNMHLMADSLGLGSCWIQGRLRKAQNGMTTEEYRLIYRFCPSWNVIEYSTTMASADFSRQALLHDFRKKNN